MPASNAKWWATRTPKEREAHAYRSALGASKSLLRALEGAESRFDGIGPASLFLVIQHEQYLMNAEVTSISDGLPLKLNAEIREVRARFVALRLREEKRGTIPKWLFSD